MENTDFLDTIVAPAKSKSVIMIMGIGGAGGNAVNHMYDLGIKDVSFMICNTDVKALAMSPIENKIQIGTGLGAGNEPDRAREAAIERLDDIMIQLGSIDAKMLILTAGLGGGTGTGAAPVIAKAARNSGLLTVAVVTMPPNAEGPKRMTQAKIALEKLKDNTDAILVVHNDDITRMHGSMPLNEAFRKADDVLATAVKGIAEMITRDDFVNVDFADVNTVMKGSGMALMGTSRSSGENKIDDVVEHALSSPLLRRLNIKGAKKVLFNLSYSREDNPLTLDDVNHTLELIQSRASRSKGGYETDIIWGAGPADLPAGEVQLTVIATGFDSDESLPEDMHTSHNSPFAGRPTLNDTLAEGVTAAPATPEKAERTEGVAEAQGTANEQPESKWEIAEHYNDMEAIYKQPAVFRRGVQLTGVNKDHKISAAEVESQKESPKEPTATEGTLF